jgi:hypothetical protein
MFLHKPAKSKHMNHQTICQLVDLTYMYAPDVVIDIMDDFSLQRCDLNNLQDPRSGGDSYIVISSVPAPAKHRPPILTEFQGLFSAGFQSFQPTFRKYTIQSAAQKSCQRMV